jgi:hypothetical protein
MEDKKWQRQARDAGLRITSRPDAAVYHTHDYNLRTLVARCRAEGLGWRYLGEDYRLRDALSDAFQTRTLRDLAAGLVRLRVRTPAELLFPWIRPMALYWGNQERA